jgi:hypothetical protein
MIMILDGIYWPKLEYYDASNRYINEADENPVAQIA